MVYNRNFWNPKMKDFSMLAPPPTGIYVHRKSGSIKEMMQVELNTLWVREWARGFM